MRLLFVLVISVLSFNIQAQDVEFPQPIIPGQSVFDVPAEFDTLWILKHSQYKNCIKNSKELVLADSMYQLLDKKSQLLQNIVAEKDSIIKYNSEAYQHYLALWEKTDKQLESVELKNVSIKRQRWYFGIAGLIVGGLLGILIF